MTAKSYTYDPLYTLKPIAEDIWIADGDTIPFFGIPFSTRMTVIRLAEGELFIHSPTGLPVGLKEEVDALGEVRYLISPSKLHYWYIDQWQEAYPKALTFASPGVRRQAANHRKRMRFDQDLLPEPTPYWQGEIDQTILRGGRFMEEVLFYHIETRTLIVADAIENFEPHKIPLPLRPFAKLVGILAPHGGTPLDYQLSYIGRKRFLAVALRKLDTWKPERIIVTHGAIIEENAEAFMRRAFEWMTTAPGEKLMRRMRSLGEKLAASVK